MLNFKSVSPQDISMKPVHLFGKVTPLLCAGTPDNFNSMIIGWGSVGYIWGLPFASVYVRPTRYTFEFIERNMYFSINCFSENAKDALADQGTKSGRDIDKMHYPGLTPLFSYEAPCFNEANLIIICRKMYTQMMQPELLCGDYKTDVLNKYYSTGESKQNFHMIFYGEIMHVLDKDDSSH
jgi:flavin reductase (DIM6/NTAB) family NADH-FMN oxidoreductase RutF